MPLQNLVRARRAPRSAPSLQTEPNPENPQPFNGYIFKRSAEQRDSDDGTSRYVPKVCKCMPLHPKTYGLACDLSYCQYCHPDPARKYTPCRPPPQNCQIGKRGCLPKKLIYVKPKKESTPATTTTEVPKVAAATKKTRTRRRCQTEQNAEHAREGKQGNCFRLSKWEDSALERIEEGQQLASAGDVILPSEGWRADRWDAQIAFLASQGLLEDFEAEDAGDSWDVTLEAIHQAEPVYTLKYQPARWKGQQKQPTCRLHCESWELVDEHDWEIDLCSVGTEDDPTLSWIMIEQSEEEGQADY